MTENKAGGILLIFIGILITAVWITVYAFQLYDSWYTTNNVLGKYMCTFLEHFWAVGKLQMLLAVITGSFAFIPGVYYLFKKSV